MPDADPLVRRLALTLPDIPRWLETRSVLLSGFGEVLGLDERTGINFVVRDEDAAYVVGWPARQAIVQASLSCTEVLAQFDNQGPVVAALPGWEKEVATLHVLGGAPNFPSLPHGAVRPLTPDEVESLSGLPPELKSELTSAIRRSTVAATIVDGAPVSFCYAASTTESLWDVSIDTLEGYRRRGFASMCVAYMAKHMRVLGKQPVWAALESNVPSLRLATKLGFEPVDRVVVFERSGAD